MLANHEFIRVVAFGASNTQRYLPGTHWFDYVEMGFKNSFGGGCGHFVNSGISGNTTADLLRRFDRELAFYRPDLVIMTIGGNDCNPAKNISPEMFYRLREKFIKTYGDNLLEISVYFHDTDKRFEPFCWYPEEDEEYNNPTAFYARYGW